MARYYAQRATPGGLLIVESTPVARNGIAYYGGPGVYLDDQVAGWRKVTDAVHAKGALIFLQLSHSGRMSHPDVIEGEIPAGPSAVRADGFALSEAGPIEIAEPRALDITEIPAIIEQYRLAGERALEAGFDGVELHSANGHLPDQFLQDGTNLREDAYGGSIENRARFALEIVDALASVWGADRVGVRVSPSGTFAGMKDSDPATSFGYLGDRLDERRIAYLHIIEPRVCATETVSETAEPVAAQHLRNHFSGPIIAAGGFDQERAEAILAAGHADFVAFGRFFVANPDLAERMRNSHPLAPHDRATLYGGDHIGYLDYPAHEAEIAA